MGKTVKRTAADVMAFLLKNRNVTESGCWEWTGGLDAAGYGRTRAVGIKTRFVHRLAMWVWSGIDPDAKHHACHKCDNPKCFNPDHLFAGTQRENLKDMRDKGRGDWSRSGGNRDSAGNLTDKCKKGHEYGENPPRHPSTKARICSQCRSENRTRWYAAHKHQCNEIRRQRYAALHNLSSEVTHGTSFR